MRPTILAVFLAVPALGAPLGGSDVPPSGPTLEQRIKREPPSIGKGLLIAVAYSGAAADTMLKKAYEYIAISPLYYATKEERGMTSENLNNMLTDARDLFLALFTEKSHTPILPNALLADPEVAYADLGRDSRSESVPAIALSPSTASSDTPQGVPAKSVACRHRNRRRLRPHP